MEYFDFLEQYSFLGNSGLDLVKAIGLFIGWLLILKFVQLVIVGRLRALSAKTKNDIDDALIGIFAHLKPPFYVLVALYFGVQMLTLSSAIETVVWVALAVVVLYEIARAINQLLGYVFTKYTARQGNDPSDIQRVAMLKVLKGLTSVIVWLIGIVLILSNLGVNVTSLVASLGIGGIAVALAAQNILGDLFGAFVIYLEKPFEVGDFIVVGEHMGTVERVGMKTTRIRSLQGEQIVISNQELTSTRIQNYKRMQQRRVTVHFGILYETNADQVEKIPQLVEKIVSSKELATFERCHFASYGDSSLDFELVYLLDTPDYNTYMDIRQEINLGIFKTFAREKIEFAYPTQTVYVKK